MAHSQLNMIVLFVCLACLTAQAFVKNKHLSHILFAIFCGSVAMSLSQKVAGDSLGSFQYIIGMGACATCNCYWLLSRSLFRKEKAISIQHLAFALIISVLILSKQGYLLADDLALLNSSSSSIAGHILSELTILLSSCVIVLSFWEGLRGFNQANKTEKAQRILFLSTFAMAVSASKISQGIFAGAPETKAQIISAIILLVIVNTQVLLFWRYKSAPRFAVNKTPENEPGKKAIQVTEKALDESELELAQQVKSLLVEKELFLQANLKVGDVAKSLDVPEYRVSKALRGTLNAKNFNQYVNQLRIGHAQSLLADPANQSWSILVVSMESGFASVGPFTRAFKSQTGLTPNQFRQQHLNQPILNVG